MKDFNLYTTGMLRVYKTGLAAMAFFAGILPAMAQEPIEDEEVAVAAAPQKMAVKQTKKYEMKQITGKVTDAATGEPLAGVQVKAFNNLYYTAMTGEDGTFTISVPVFVTSLTAQVEGYNMSRIALNGANTLTFKLYTDRFLGDYKAKNSANKSVDISGFEQTTSLTADDEIHNRLGADVRSVGRSALPGQGSAMFINGLNSLNSNAQPLIVVDGVIFDQFYTEAMIHTGYFNNLLESINMDDVEDIEVLKNGTAIYGAKAANGVILIRTKRNKSMATRIDVNAQWGLELTPKTMDVMNADEYRSYASEMLKTTGTKLTDFKFLNTDPSYYYYNMYHNNTDWKDEVYHTGVSQNYSIHVQGGDEIANYNLSVGYMDVNSTLKDNDLQRFNIRFNTDIVLNKWWTTRFDAAYTNYNRNLRDAGIATTYGTVPTAATNTLAMIKSPFTSPFAFDVYGNRTDFLDDADSYLSEVLGQKAGIANPRAILETGDAHNKNRSDLTQVNLVISPKWQPTKNFSLNERFSYTTQSFDESYFTPIVGMPIFQPEGTGTTVENTKSSYYSSHHSIFSDTYAEWAIPLGEHRLDVNGGVRFMSDSFRSSLLLGYNTGNDKTPNTSSSQLYKKTTGTDTSWKTLTYYAHVGYNYKEKYYLDGAFSFEASSRFGTDADAGVKLFGVPWGFFPSIQGAWVVSNEDWFKTNNLVNYLKINAGFESVGNDDVNNLATLTYMQAGIFYGQGASVSGTYPSIYLGNIGNTKLRWETTNRLNAGLEGNFFNNRLGLKFNFYKSWTSNLVSLGTLAYVAGLENYWTNGGKLENTGFDVAANVKVLNLRDFKMEVGASVGHYKNKLTELPISKEGKAEFETSIYGGTVLSRVGQSAGVFYGYKTNGVFSSSDKAEASGLYIKDKTGAKTYFKAGDMIFVDRDGNHEINDNDRCVIGNPNPDIYGNFSAKFYIGKRWTVSAGFNYSIGNDIYNYQRSLLEGGNAFINQTTALNRRWMVEGQVTDIPSISYNDPMGNSRFSDRWIEDGSYLKLKNVTVSYKLPVQNEYIQGITVWAAGNNLVTFTKYLGNDPEVCAGNSVLSQGIDAGYLNYGRSFTLGVKINL